MEEFITALHGNLFAEQPAGAGRKAQAGRVQKKPGAGAYGLMTKMAAESIISVQV